MRPHAWRMALALTLGAGLASQALAQPMTRGGRPVGAPHPRELYQHWFGGGSSKPVPKDTKSKKESAPARKEAPAPRPEVAEPPAGEEKSPAEKAAERFQREQRAFLRRLAVCDRLRQIALQTNDESLMRRADELQEQAWSLCQQRTGIVPVDDLDASSPEDEEILDRQLGSVSSRPTRVDRLYTIPAQDSPRELAQEDEP